MICCPPPPMDQHGGREGPGQSVKYVKTACYKMIGAIVIGKEPVWFDLLLYSPCLQPGPCVTCLCLLDISSHAGTIVFILEFKFVDFQWKLEILHCSTFYSKPPSEVWDCFCLACGLRPLKNLRPLVRNDLEPLSGPIRSGESSILTLCSLCWRDLGSPRRNCKDHPALVIIWAPSLRSKLYCHGNLDVTGSNVTQGRSCR